MQACFDCLAGLKVKHSYTSKLVSIACTFRPWLIPDCSAHYAPAILQSFVIRSFFFRKMAPYSCLAGLKVNHSYTSKLVSNACTFRPWYHIIYSGSFVFPAKFNISRISFLYFIKESCPLSLGLNSLISITLCTLAGLADITTT